MPIYDYHCHHCDKTFDLLVRASTLVACPHCGHAEPEQLISKPLPKSKIDVLRKKARSQATREGHFSHYAPSERPRD